MIINLEVISKKLLNLLNLIKAYLFCIHKLTQIVVVNEDKNLMLIAFQISTSSFKGFNNSQKLTIISFLSSLCKNHLFEKKNAIECHWLMSDFIDIEFVEII